MMASHDVRATWVRPPKATMRLVVRYSRRYRLRLWLARVLIVVAAWILDWRLEIVGGGEELDS